MWDGFVKIYPIGESNILGNAKPDHDPTMITYALSDHSCGCIVVYC